MDKQTDRQLLEEIVNQMESPTGACYLVRTELIDRIRQQLRTKPPSTITVVTCTTSWHQAIYVDGGLRSSDSSLYANVVAEYAEGRLVNVESFDVTLCQSTFPDTLEELNLPK